MDKETYVKRMAELAEIKQKALEYNRKEREKAAESYITENCPFKKGDRIKYNGKPGDRSYQGRTQRQFFV